MNLIRRAPVYPKDRDLSRVIQAAASRLARKFDGLDPHSLGLSFEACSLICQCRERVEEEIERCAQVFAWALPRDEQPFSDLSLVAFADRLGLFALLARECNVGTVVCHNTEGADVDDARVVAKALASPADHYVFGDLEDLEFVLKHRGLSCDVFVSRGGLAGLSDTPAFFSSIAEVSGRAISFEIAVTDRSRPRSERRAGEAILDAFRDDLARAGFEAALVPVRPARRGRDGGARLNGLLARGLGLVFRAADGFNGGAEGMFVLRGGRGPGRYPIEHAMRPPRQRSAGLSEEPREIVTR